MTSLAPGLGRRLRMRWRESYVLSLTLTVLMVACVLFFVARSLVASQVRSDFLASSDQTARLVARAGFFPQFIYGGPYLTVINTERLDQVVQALRSTEPVLDVTVWRPDGQILYSVDSRLIGTHPAMPASVTATLAGRTSHSIERAAPGHGDNNGGTHIDTVIPIRAPLERRPVAAFELDLSYARLEHLIAARRETAYWILGAMLALLYAGLLPRAIVSSRSARAARDPQRTRILADVEEAMRRGQLELHYQPIARVSDLSVTAVEALLRWQHPERGTIAPGEYLPTVEASPLAWSLDIYVLELAIAQAADWAGRGRPLPIAVNLSASTLVDARLPTELARLLQRHGTDASLIELEATEGDVIAEPAAAAGVLQRIRDQGLRSIAIDDFGTGHSSLARLHELPLDQLKIDRSFVSRMVEYGDSAAIKAIVALAHNLGLTVVAEGVEDADAHAMLDEVGCDEFQGFWLARPLPAAELACWLDSHALAPTFVRSTGETERRGRQRVEMRDRYFGAALVEALEAIVILNDNREYVECNEAACELLGVSRARLLGSRMDDFTPEAGRNELARAWAAFLRDGTARGSWVVGLPDGRRREIAYRRKANFVRGHHVSVLHLVRELTPDDPKPLGDQVASLFAPAR